MTDVLPPEGHEPHVAEALAMEVAQVMRQWHEANAGVFNPLCMLPNVLEALSINMAAVLRRIAEGEAPAHIVFCTSVLSVARHAQVRAMSVLWDRDSAAFQDALDALHAVIARYVERTQAEDEA
jgi:DNA-binding LytR/AlgR family response regulator